MRWVDPEQVLEVRPDVGEAVLHGLRGDDARQGRKLREAGCPDRTPSDR